MTTVDQGSANIYLRSDGRVEVVVRDVSNPDFLLTWSMPRESAGRFFAGGYRLVRERRDWPRLAVAASALVVPALAVAGLRLRKGPR